MSINRLVLTGRLTKDPEVRIGNISQSSVARFSLAVDRGKNKNGEDVGTDFPHIVCFGKTADLAEKYLKKGKLIGLEGRIQTGSYEKDGKTFYTTDIVAERIEFLDRAEKKEASADPDIPEGFSRISEDDIPF